jgi:AcrR family transcriptional regulator
VTDQPLYLRIADEIAADIRSGRLPAGRPAPSTRRIVRDWNVAMATATKVLGALRAAGLVETVPGSGTIVRGQGDPEGGSGRRAGPGPRSGLSRREIVAAGVRIADADGLPFVTMRRVADSLGVSTMALYRHVPHKAALTLQMADSVFAEARPPKISVEDWRGRLAAVCRLFWEVCKRHPWAAEAFSLSRPQVMPNVMPLAEYSLGTLQAMGFGAHDMMCAHINLLAHVRGLALVRLAELQAEQDTGMTADAWMDGNADGLREWTDAAVSPGLGQVLSEPFDFNLDVIFEYGLQRLLDGLDAQRRRLRQESREHS